MTQLKTVIMYNVTIPHTKRINAVAEMVRNSGIFSKETLIPLSLVLMLVAPVGYITQLAQRVEQLENRIEVLHATSITKEVFQLKMENFETKLDAVLAAIEQKKERK